LSILICGNPKFSGNLHLFPNAFDCLFKNFHPPTKSPTYLQSPLSHSWNNPHGVYNRESQRTTGRVRSAERFPKPRN
jgi:hypothetical protein